MLAIFQGKLSALLCLIFPLALLGGLLLQHLISGMRREIEMAEYAAARGPIEELPPLPAPEERLPGYLLMTRTDYLEMAARLRRELELELGRG